MTPGPCLTALTLADPPALWSELGFDVTEGRCEVGGIAVELLGTHPIERSGILGWSFDRPVDLPAAVATVAPAPSGRRTHPNGVVGVDHVVVAVDDLDATRRALAASGIAVRREWSRNVGDTEVSYLFSVVGPAVLECVAGTGAAAGLWGVTLVAEDLEVAAVHLGSDPERIRDAVQPGRRILGLDTRPRGGSVRLAVMSLRT